MQISEFISSHDHFWALGMFLDKILQPKNLKIYNLLS